MRCERWRRGCVNYSGEANSGCRRTYRKGGARLVIDEPKSLASRRSSVVQLVGVHHVRPCVCVAIVCQCAYQPRLIPCGSINMRYRGQWGTRQKRVAACIHTATAADAQSTSSLQPDTTVTIHPSNVHLVCVPRFRPPSVHSSGTALSSHAHSHQHLFDSSILHASTRTVACDSCCSQRTFHSI